MKATSKKKFECKCHPQISDKEITNERDLTHAKAAPDLQTIFIIVRTIKKECQ
jgi:hypothetical protein